MNAAADDLAALGVLAEPQRARIYAHLAASSEPCTRQEVSEALGIGRTLVAFHLDKLERARLVCCKRGGTARGARGRPPQRYAVTDRELSATMPPRRYELLAEVLVQAVGEQLRDQPLHEAALRVARRRGVELARGQGVIMNRRRPREGLADLLTHLGYEPRHDGDGVVLGNCPFRRLRAYDTELVCSINAALAAGYVEGLGVADALTPRLRPCPLNCCVVFERSA